MFISDFFPRLGYKTMPPAFGTLEYYRLEAQKNWRQRSFAFAKYYEVVRDSLTRDYETHTTITRHIGIEEIPTHIKNEMIEMATILKKTWECPICMDMIQPANLEITPCGHYYCKVCLDTIKSQANVDARKCAICRKAFKQTPTP